MRATSPGPRTEASRRERPALDWGWTAIRPGRGLLPEADFAKPYLNIWDLADGTHARMGQAVAVPIEAFPGVMGVALDEPGGHSTMPPRRNGGNMDIRQLAAGSTLFLPVLVDGALFSVGEADEDGQEPSRWDRAICRCTCSPAPTAGSWLGPIAKVIRPAATSW